MRVRVHGTGSVGCWFAATALRSGHAVELVGHGALYDRQQHMGQQVRLADGDNDIDRACFWETGHAIDLHVLAVKRGSLPSVRANSGRVLGIQNGLGLRHELEAYGWDAVAGTFDGEVRMDGGCVVQRSSKVTLTVSAPVGLEARVARDYAAVETRRFLLIEPLATIEAATGCRHGALKRGAGHEAHEAVLAETAAAVDATASMLARVRFVAQRLKSEGTVSLAVDVLRGRRGELDWLTGEVVRRVAAPWHERYLSAIEAQLAEDAVLAS